MLVFILDTAVPFVSADVCDDETFAQAVMGYGAFLYDRLPTILLFLNNGGGSDVVMLRIVVFGSAMFDFSKPTDAHVLQRAVPYLSVSR